MACDVCHRTMLKGERAEAYLTPSRERRLVCQLCAPRAQREGWIREAAAPEMPARPQRQPERRGLLRRRRAAAKPDEEPAAPLPPDPAPTSGMVERLDDDAGAAPVAGPPVAAAQPAPRDGRADERPAEDRPGARALQRVRASAHGGGDRPHARHPARVRVDIEVLGRRGASDRGVGAVLVPVRRGPLRRPRARSVPGSGPGAVRASRGRQDWNCTVDASGRIELGNGSAEEAEGRRVRRPRPPRRKRWRVRGTARIVIRRAPQARSRSTLGCGGAAQYFWPPSHGTRQERKLPGRTVRTA